MSRWSNLIDVAKRPPCPSTPTVTLAPSPGRAQPLWIGLRGGPRVPLRGLLRIGSDRGCTLVVDDPYVSAHHAEVHLQDGHAMLVDLGSKNGTWLDEVRIDACPWVPGVRVRVGGRCSSSSTPRVSTPAHRRPPAIRRAHWDRRASATRPRWSAAARPSPR
ncbi:MAG: FHA domain-containing protein [Deltaproteobacteria bacterium]|nr:FHA domain-containing protein [Deltaproteobacteria bacterium]